MKAEGGGGQEELCMSQYVTTQPSRREGGRTRGLTQAQRRREMGRGGLGLLLLSSSCPAAVPGAAGNKNCLEAQKGGTTHTTLHKRHHISTRMGWGERDGLETAWQKKRASNPTLQTKPPFLNIFLPPRFCHWLAQTLPPFSAQTLLHAGNSIRTQKGRKNDANPNPLLERDLSFALAEQTMSCQAALVTRSTAFEILILLTLYTLFFFGSSSTHFRTKKT